MFCPKCGSEVAEGSAFCGKCGAPAGAQASGVAPAGGGAPAPKKGGAKIGVIAAVAVVVVVLIAGFATNWFGLAGVQPKEAVEVPAASQDAGNAQDAGDGAEGDARDAATGDAVKSAVEAYTWDELSQISAEIGAAGNEAAAIEVAKKYNLCTSEGKLDGTQVKSVTLADGTQTTVQIIGFAHDETESGKKAGITFIFGSCVNELPMNYEEANAGGWESSAIRTYLNTDLDMLLPEDLQKVITPVRKTTNNAGQTESIEDVTATTDAFWLLSKVEMRGESVFSENDLIAPEDMIMADIQNAEGEQYKFFYDLMEEHKRDDSIAPELFTVKFFGDAQVDWWLRSPRNQSYENFSYISDDGRSMYEAAASVTKGVVPCFSI